MILVCCILEQLTLSDRANQCISKADRHFRARPVSFPPTLNRGERGCTRTRYDDLDPFLLIVLTVRLGLGCW